MFIFHFLSLLFCYTHLIEQPIYPLAFVVTVPMSHRHFFRFWGCLLAYINFVPPGIKIEASLDASMTTWSNLICSPSLSYLFFWPPVDFRCANTFGWECVHAPAEDVFQEFKTESHKYFGTSTILPHLPLHAHVNWSLISVCAMNFDFWFHDSVSIFLSLNFDFDVGSWQRQL